MNWFQKTFGKENWRLVKTLDRACTTTHHITSVVTQGKVYCYLFESNKGKRKYELKGTFVNMTDSNISAFYETTEQYLITVYPWLQGRKFPDIPSYIDVPAEDFMNHMKS